MYINNSSDAIRCPSLQEKCLKASVEKLNTKPTLIKEITSANITVKHFLCLTPVSSSRLAIPVSCWFTATHTYTHMQCHKESSGPLVCGYTMDIQKLLKQVLKVLVLVGMQEVLRTVLTQGCRKLKQSGCCRAWEMSRLKVNPNSEKMLAGVANYPLLSGQH